MDFILLPLTEADVPAFKKDMQAAFQAYSAELPGQYDADMQILPEEDIDESLAADGVEAYKAIVDGQMAGGAVIQPDKEEGRCLLHLLYIRADMQGRGIGQKIIRQLELLHPEVKAWETLTPYFAKRNIHFYINCCGYSAVEFFSDFHKADDVPEDMPGGDYFFRFEKSICSGS